MFEKFTNAARETVLAAVTEAQQDHAPKVTEQHLLLALLTHDLLVGSDVTRDKVVAAYRAVDRQAGLTEADAAALRDLGIDLDEVVKQVENAHGENVLASRDPRRERRHIPFTPEAKQVLVGALREGRELNDRTLGAEHILLAMAARGEVAAQVLAANGLNYRELRAKAS
jgi:ATP-dependent Clp protease ATP-binding subunit ClpA